jgi:hypothetical protein
MELTARLYQCARCHCQVILCSHCDRGNIYCNTGCAEQARKASLKAAGSRYQQSRRGRFSHAERQRRFRAKREKVTHQGSPLVPANAPLPPRSTAPSDPVATVESDIHCHFCRQLCSPWLRLGFLRYRRDAIGDAGAADRSVHKPPDRTAA